MRNLSALLSLILIIGCNSQQQSSLQQTGQNDSGRTNTQDTPVSKTGFSATAFDKKTTPLKDSVKGNIIDGASWTDSEGENTVLLSQTENKMVNDKQSQRIYASCYKKENGVWKQKWLVQDRIEDCEVDATCEFLPRSLTVTDTDANGFAEVTFLYKLSCKGDVSPDEKKLIMYEGSRKYAIRGTTILQFNGGKEGGEKKIDPSFNSAPKALLDLANIQWDKFGITRY